MKYPIHITDRKGKTDPLSDFLCSLNIIIHGFGRQYARTTPVRISSDFEIIYCIAGTCYIQIGENSYTGNRGDLFLIPPYTKNKIDISDANPSHNLWVHFDITPLYLTNSFIIATMGKLQEYHIHVGERSVFMTLYEMMESETVAESMGFQEMRLSAFRMIVIEIVRTRLKQTQDTFSLEATPNKHNDFLLQADMFIQENLHRKIQVSEIAAALSVSEPYLFKIFSSVMHISPTAYINLCKAKAAKLAIETSTAPLSEIAENLGFHSYYYFSNFFKRIYGVSPKAFRKEVVIVNRRV